MEIGSKTKGINVIGTKSVFRNKLIKDGQVTRNRSRFVG